MNPKAPQILNDIVDAIRTSNLTAIMEDTEGRVNSKKDEDMIISWLSKHPKFGQYLIQEEGQIRKFADMVVRDYDGVTLHAANIKTSLGNVPDNVYSKLGLLWAYTNLTTEQFDELGISNKVYDEDFTKLIMQYKADINRDYWYISVNKNDFSHTIVRGVKQIVNWNMNPTNNLQITWKKEHAVPEGTDDFESSFKKVIINGVFYCWYKKTEQWKEGIELYKMQANG